MGNVKELTPFQIKVYNLVSSIPYGQTRSYSWVAERIGTSPRAIGKVLSKNPLPIVIPCHRVIKKQGGFGGFKCGMEMKKKILEIEYVLRYTVEAEKIHCKLQI